MSDIPLGQTDKNLHILAANSRDGNLTLVHERKIPIVTIKGISMTNLRDDWFVSVKYHLTTTLCLHYTQALNLGPTEEGDPLISCVFKTEFATHLMQLTHASINLVIAPTFVHSL